MAHLPFRFTDMHGKTVHAGNRIRLPGPGGADVTAVMLSREGLGCPHGIATYQDPETGEPRVVCLGAVELA